MILGPPDKYLMRLKELFLESEEVPGTPIDVPAPFKLGDTVFLKHESHVSAKVDGRHYPVLLPEGTEFKVIGAVEYRIPSHTIQHQPTAAYVRLERDGQEFSCYVPAMEVDFGIGSWKEWKKKWINSLKESYDWMEWSDVKVGGEYTKVDDIMPNIGLHKDWKQTYAELGHQAREEIPKGTKVKVTNIVRDEFEPGRINLYVEFQTPDGKQYFVADDAFCFHFWNGSYKDWQLRFFHDIGLPKDDDLKEDGPLKVNTFKPGDVRVVSRAQAVRGELPNGKGIWFRAGNKLIVSSDLSGILTVTTRQRPTTKMTIPKDMFVKYTVWEKDYKGSEGYVKEDGPFKGPKQYKPLERGQELSPRHRFTASMDGRKIDIGAGAKLRYLREIDGVIVFRGIGPRFSTQANRDKFLTANKWDFLDACSEIVK